MPWNPIKKFPDVIAYIKAKGYTNEFTRDVLETAIIEVEGVVRPPTIDNIGKIMIRLGFIAANPNGTFRFNGRTAVK